MDLAYSKEHIDTFVDRLRRQRFFAAGVQAQGNRQARHRPGHAGIDLGPAARQLRRVHLLRRPRQAPAAGPGRSTPQLPETKRKAFALLLESLLALRRENKEVLWSSMVKDTMKRKKPSFNEAYHGYRTFSELLEDAQKEGLAGAGHRQAQPDLRGDALRLGDWVNACYRAAETQKPTAAILRATAPFRAKPGHHSRARGDTAAVRKPAVRTTLSS